MQDKASGFPRFSPVGFAIDLRTGIRATIRLTGFMNQFTRDGLTLAFRLICKHCSIP
jgi:hypothetical protein